MRLLSEAVLPGRAPAAAHVGCLPLLIKVLRRSLGSFVESDLSSRQAKPSHRCAINRITIPIHVNSNTSSQFKFDQAQTCRAQIKDMRWFNSTHVLATGFNLRLVLKNVCTGEGALPPLAHQPPCDPRAALRASSSPNISSNPPGIKVPSQWCFPPKGQEHILKPGGY